MKRKRKKQNRLLFLVCGIKTEIEYRKEDD